MELQSNANAFQLKEPHDAMWRVVRLCEKQGWRDSEYPCGLVSKDEGVTDLVPVVELARNG